MHSLKIGALAAAALTLSGCNMLNGYQIFSAFGSHPVVTKSFQAGATKADLLAIQKPQQVTPTRRGSSQCFDYTLEKDGKSQPFYVGFTDSGLVNANGFISCGEAMKEGFLNSNELPKQIY